VRREPYSPLFDELARKFPVEDDTDINDDVCFTFLVTAARVLAVKLSMVGPYAVVMAVSSAEPDAPLTVVPGPDAAANDDERAVLRILGRHGFRVLTEEELERSVRFTLEDAEIVPLYRALFAFEGLLPWKRL
jgi:hypothetical protein